MNEYMRKLNSWNSFYLSFGKSNSASCNKLFIIWQTWHYKKWKCRTTLLMVVHQIYTKILWPRTWLPSKNHAIVHCKTHQKNTIITRLKTYNTHKVVWTTQRGINYAAAVVHNTQRIRDPPDGEPSSSSDSLSLSWLLFDLIKSNPPSRHDRWYAWQQ